MSVSQVQFEARFLLELRHKIEVSETLPGLREVELARLERCAHRLLELERSRDVLRAGLNDALASKGLVEVTSKLLRLLEEEQRTRGEPTRIDYGEQTERLDG